MNKLSEINPKVFLNAARLVGTYQDEFACNAIEKWSSIRSIELRYFADVLRPRGQDNVCVWYARNNEDSLSEECRTARIIGLLLCAELVKDKFLPNKYWV